MDTRAASSAHLRLPRGLRRLLVRFAFGVLAASFASACGLPSRVVAASAVPAPSGATAASSGAASIPVQQTKTFLWRISSPTATVHLLGSIHVASPDIYPLDPRIESAFQRAHTLVLETALDPASQVQAGQKMASAGTYPAGDSIDLHLDREVLELLQQRLKRTGSPFTTVRSYRPWFVAVILVLAEMQRLGYRPDLGIDIHFAEKAKSRKRILGLETLDQQAALFSGMSESVQESMLKETLLKLDGLPEYLRKALVSWRTGDGKALDELMLAPMRKDYPAVFQRIFVDRNRRMAAAIEDYLKGTGDHFVVVGSGHVIGPEGILDLLQAKGYTPVQQ